MSQTSDPTAEVFAALGDRLRWRLVDRLSSGVPCSITQLTHGSEMTRQAVTKHLRVLETAGLVTRERIGREQQVRLNLAPLNEAQYQLHRISNQWGAAIGRLKTLVENSQGKPVAETWSTLDDHDFSGLLRK